MTFYNPSNKGPIIGIVSFIILGILGTIFFFSFKECKSSGFMRSGKTSDATELYQVFPAESDGRNYLISLEGVFKTRVYERSGGITQRSGSTDIRLTMHDIATGEVINREVIGDNSNSYTKILGVGNNMIWLYNKKDGLHSRNVSNFEIAIRPENIIAANNSLSEGFAQANDYLGNLDELFIFNSYENALLVTTISGKKMWINASTFASVEAPFASEKKSDMDDLIEEIIDQAMKGQTPELERLYDEIIQTSSDLSAFSDIEHTAQRVSGIDSCDYSFDGNTVKTIVKSNCKFPEKLDAVKENSGVLIEPVFLSQYNTADQKYINPNFLTNNNCIILHAKSIGEKTDLMISSVDTKSLKTQWSTKTGIVLKDHKSSYTIGGTFSGGDTMFVCIENQLFSININTGKIIWKSVIGKNDHFSQLYYIGSAVQNGKRYFLAANSFFTVLQQEGFFSSGRTDYQLIVIDAVTGKSVKKIEITDSKPEKLPYYLGMANGSNWFYSKPDGVHTRSLPDLKINAGGFDDILKKGGIESPLVNTSRYDDAIEEKYIAMDAKSGQIYFTTQNGLHYIYDLASLEISEVKAPEDKMYENWMANNPYVEFYRMHLQNWYHHDLLLQDGRTLYFEGTTSVSKLKAKENKPETPGSSPLKSNQFIEAEFLTNGISLNNKFSFNDNRNTPLTLNPEEKTFYIFHKVKISPDAHQIISKFNYDNETVVWALDITKELGIQAELLRIYTLNDKFYYIFKTHPDLDDNFICIAIDGNKGNVVWNVKF